MSITQKIYKLKDRGFFHILGSNVVNKIIQFCNGIFIVRILTQNDFGIYTYSQNLISFFLLINGVGISQGLLQFGTKNITIYEKQQLLKLSIKISVIFNFIIMLAIFIYYKIGNFKIVEAKEIFLWMILYPIFNIIIELIQIKNRIDLENKEYSKFININTLLNLFFMIFLGKIYGIYGVILGKYIANIFTVIYGLKYIKNIFIEWTKITKVSREKKIQILKFSVIAMFNNSISQLLYLIDIFLIGSIIGSMSIIAYYKTATLIPFALNFIPLSIMIYIYPNYSKHANDIDYLKKEYKNLLKYMFIFNGIVTITLLLISRYIIYIFFGREYEEAIKPFQILLVGYFFASTFRIPSGNILAAIGNIKVNLYIAILCGVLNILLDIYFIKVYGDIGAAIATTMIMIISGVLGNIYIIKSFYKEKN